MLAQRVLAAAVGAPLLLALAYAGGWPFTAAAAVLAVIAWRELAAMLTAREIRPSGWLGLPAALAFIVAARFGAPDLMVGFVAALVLAALAYAVASGGRFTFADAAASVLGALYTGLLFGYLVLLRGLGFGQVALVLGVTWAADTAAYFAGRAFGRHKLAPRISPGKSVEGALAGLVAAAAVGAAGGAFAGATPSVGLGVGLIAGVAGPLGDLAESTIKRWCGVKDSGSILPGHGGVLDRFDSLLFTAPCAYYLLLTVIH